MKEIQASWMMVKRGISKNSVTISYGGDVCINKPCCHLSLSLKNCLVLVRNKHLHACPSTRGRREVIESISKCIQIKADSIHKTPVGEYAANIVEKKNILLFSIVGILSLFL